MRKSILITLFSIIYSYCIGQTPIIEWKNPNLEIKEKTVHFEYLIANFDTTNSVKVATLSVLETNSKNNLVSIFNSFWEASNKLGANSFCIEKSFLSSSNDTIEIIISAFYTTEEFLDKNIALYPHNMVYLFGDLNKNRVNGKKIKFNGEKITLFPLEYIAYQNKIGEEAIVSIGGFLGAKMWIKGRKDRIPSYLSFSSFGVGPGSFGTVSISVNTGRIYPVETNFGQFLINVLHKKKI